MLLCGHLEAFVEELGAAALESFETKQVSRTPTVPVSRFYYHLSREIIEDIRNTKDQDRLADKIFDFLASDLPLWSPRSGPLPQPISAEKFNDGFSNPLFDKVKAYFKRFGYDSYEYDLGCKLKAEYFTTIAMVDELVRTRNDIAHGDKGATKTPKEIDDAIALLRLYCIATDDVFARWWKSNFCAIR